MPTWIYRPDDPNANERGMVEKGEYYYRKFMLEEDKRMMVGNEYVSINYIADEMSPTRHMALPVTAAPITSKHKFREITKQQGCIEVGNETLKPRKPIEMSRKDRREAIRTAIKDLKENKIPEGERAAIKRHSEAVNYVNRNRVRKA